MKIGFGCLFLTIFDCFLRVMHWETITNYYVIMYGILSRFEINLVHDRFPSAILK